MSWPTSPSNNQETTINGMVYRYDSAVGVWKRVGQLAEDVLASTYTTANLDVTGREIVANISVTDSVNSALIPGTNVTFDLGAPDYRWRDIYLSGSTIDLGGTLISSDGQGNISFGNLTLNIDDGSVDGANVSGAVAFATTANSVAGANVSGEVSFAAVANSVASANITGSINLSTYATTANAVAGANVSGAVAFATTANSVVGANVSGEVSFAATANAVAGSNVSGAVGLATYATTANSVAGGNVSGAVGLATYATTANAVAGGNVSGAVSYATTANSVAGANVSGQVGNALVAGTVYGATQTNITAVGTLGSLSVTANVSAGNLTTGGQVVATGNVVSSAYLKGVDGSLSGNLVVTGDLTVNGTTTTVNTTNISYTDPIIELHNTADSSPLTTNDGKDIGLRIHYYDTQDRSAFLGRGNDSGSLEYYSDGTESGGVFTGTYGNIKGASFISSISTGTQPLFVNSTTRVANLNAATAGVANTVNDSAQTNITSVGTLVSLAVTGNVTSGNANLGNLTTSNFFSGNGSMLSSLTGGNVTGAVAYATTANAVAGGNVSGQVSFAATANAVAGGNVSGAVSFATTANAVAGGNVSGQVGNALVSGTVYTAAQPNITSVGSLANLTIAGILTHQQSQEVIPTTITGATGTVTHDFSTGGTFYHTGIVANFTANITNLPTTAGRASVVILVLVQGATARICNAIQIAGTAQTVKWLNSTVPTGTANKVETMMFTILNIGGTYTVIGQLSSYG